MDCNGLCLTDDEHTGSMGRRDQTGKRASISLAPQQDPPHQPAARALDAAEQLSLAGEPAAAVVAHPGEGVALDGKPPDRCLINAVYLSAADGKR